MLILMRFWREIAIALLVMALAASGAFALGQSKKIGERDATIVGLNRAVAERDNAINEMAARASRAATFERGSYEACQTQASESTQQAFSRGVAVGKTLGRRETCAAQP